MTTPQPSPAGLMQIGLGFWASKTLLSAVELGLFTELARSPATVEELMRLLGLHQRSARDFLDALVALGMLERDPQGRYRNTPETDLYLDRTKPSYIGGLLEMANSRLYGFWGSLTEALRTGEPQNEAKNSDADLFSGLYADPARLEQFLAAMSGASLGNAVAIARQFPWQNYSRFADIGCAQGASPVQIALAHPHLSGIGYDLPQVEPVFRRYVESRGLGSRVGFQAGDFFRDPLPEVEVLIMGQILHDWDLPQKQMLLAKAYGALPTGGVLIVYDAIIDDERRHNALGLLMSLNMLIETKGGFDYSGADCQQWMRQTGFRDTRVEALTGTHSMVIGFK
jgi:hypothetical protein